MTIEDRVHDALHEYADPIEPAPGSWERIRARFDEPAPAPSRPRRRSVVLVSLSIVAVVAIVGALVGALLGLGIRVACRDDRHRCPRDAGARVLAVTTSGQPVVLGSLNGNRETGYDASGIAAGTQVAVSPDGLDGYLVEGPGEQSCANHQILRLPVAAGARGGDLIATHATEPTVSPDGRYLAYLHCPEEGGRADEIVLRDLAGGSERITSAPAGAFFVDHLEFAADSRHVVFGYEDATGHDTVRELDVVAGDPTAGRVLDTSPAEWVGVRGRTGDALGVVHQQGGTETAPTVMAISGANPLVTTALFGLPGLPDQVISDPSGRHILAVVDHTLYRWSVGDATATKVADDVTGAAWIPDAPTPPPLDTSLPNGIVAVRNGELAVLGATDGAQHCRSARSGQEPRSVPPSTAGRSRSPVRRHLRAATTTRPVPRLQKLIPMTGQLTDIAGSAYSPTVNGKGLVAYGYVCDGNGLGFTDLSNGDNFRSDALGGKQLESEPRIQAVYPLDWSPDGTKLLYRVQLAGDPSSHLYVGALWPAVRQADTHVVEIPGGASITAAAFVTDDTLAIISRDRDGSRFDLLPIASATGSTAKEGLQWDKTSLLFTGHGEVSLPGPIRSLVADPSGHFLLVAEDGTLYRWTRGDPTLTKIADGVTAAVWIPWS